MKGTLYSLVFAVTLVAMMSMTFAWTGHSSVLAQEAELPGTLSLDVTIETATGEVITLPLRIDDATFISFTELAPSAAILDAMVQVAGQELLTITVLAPAVFTPMVSALVFEPVDVPVPPLGVSMALTATHSITEAVASTTATETETATDTVAVTVPEVVEPEPAVVTAAANLREGPSTGADVVGQISADTAVTLTGRNSDGTWYQLDDGSWVVGFVVQNPPSDLPIMLDGAAIVRASVPATVTGAAVVLREGPSLSDASLGAYEDGTVTAVISQAPDGAWLEVLTPDGKVGWMSGDFLQVGETMEELPTVISTVSSAVTGQVVDADGEGIGDIVVSATQTGGLTGPRVEATTDVDGAFTLYTTPGPANAWTVQISGVGCDSRIVNDRCQLFGYFAAVPEAEVTLPPEEPITLVYEDATSFIAGTVVDADGEPMGQNIRVNGVREDGARTSGLTSSSGKFVLPAAAGKWTVGTDSGPSIEVEVPEKSAPEPVDVPIS
jgi:uncharacterized protein YgiM (DUF1202 family)